MRFQPLNRIGFFKNVHNAQTEVKNLQRIFSIVDIFFALCNIYREVVSAEWKLKATKQHNHLCFDAEAAIICTSFKGGNCC